MFCPMCGAPNEDEATYCGNCGVALSADVPPLEQPVVAVDEPVGAVEEAVAAVDEPVKASVLSDTQDDQSYLPPPPPLPKPPAPPAPARYTPASGSSAPVSGMAVASLVLGIAGLTVLPFISSVFAVIFGYMARREIRQQPLQTSGDGIAVAGIVLGWIGVGLMLLAILGIGGFMGCGLCSSMGSGGWQ